MIEITKDQGLSGKMFSKITESVPDNDREVILDYYHKNILFVIRAKYINGKWYSIDNELIDFDSNIVHEAIWLEIPYKEME